MNAPLTARLKVVCLLLLGLESGSDGNFLGSALKRRPKRANARSLQVPGCMDLKAQFEPIKQSSCVGYVYGHEATETSSSDQRLALTASAKGVTNLANLSSLFQLLRTDTLEKTLAQASVTGTLAWFAV